MDTGEKMGVVVGDQGVKMVEMGGEGLGDELVLTQDSLSKLNGFFREQQTSQLLIGRCSVSNCNQWVNIQ